MKLFSGKVELIANMCQLGNSVCDYMGVHVWVQSVYI